jgi:hypothetical protein
MAAKQALYHRDGWRPKPLFILAEDEEGGTLDLGDESGNLIVGGCQVKAEPENGCCTRGAATPKDGPKAKSPKGKK